VPGPGISVQIRRGPWEKKAAYDLKLNRGEKRVYATQQEIRGNPESNRRKEGGALPGLRNEQFEAMSRNPKKAGREKIVVREGRRKEQTKYHHVGRKGKRSASDPVACNGLTWPHKERWRTAHLLGWKKRKGHSPWAPKSEDNYGHGCDRFKYRMKRQRARKKPPPEVNRRTSKKEETPRRGEGTSKTRKTLKKKEKCLLTRLRAGEYPGERSGGGEKNVATKRV